MHRRDVEIITLAHDEDEPSAGERPRTGYRFADMRASLLMGIGSIFWLTVFKVATFFVYQWVWPHWAPWTAYAAFSLSLIYQFCIHTELVDRLPRPIEYVFNTPATTGCTTAPTRSTWTATTAGS